MVRDYLATFFGITDASVRRHDPEDFVIRFSRLEDMEAVLHTRVPNAPFLLIWHPWRWTSLASAGLFRYRVLMGMRRVPLHARSVAVAQTILGRACTRIELAPPTAAPMDDDREFFVAAWCLHPRFIPDEKIIFIPKPDVRVPGGRWASALMRSSLMASLDYAIWYAYASLSTKTGAPLRHPLTMKAMMAALGTMMILTTATLTVATPASTTAAAICADLVYSGS
jgi:hypothetical protein